MNLAVIPHQRGLFGGAAQQCHHRRALPGVGDRVDDREVLLGGDGEQLRSDRQPPRHRQVQAVPPLGINLGEDRFTDAVVTESHRVMGPGLGHQNDLFEGRCQALFHHFGRLGGRGRQHAELGSPAQTRHRLQHVPGGGRQGRQPGHRKFGHLRTGQK